MPRDVFAEYKELLEYYREVRKARRSHRIRPYSSHDKYVARLKEFRWEEGKVICPRCKIRCARVQDVNELKIIDKLRCTLCKRSFSITVGTPLHGSRLTLFKWFEAIKFIQENKDIANTELAKKLMVTSQTAMYVKERLKTFENGRYLEMNVNIDL